MKLTLEEKLTYCEQSILRWMIDNIYIYGTVAAIIVLDRAIRGGESIGGSVYDAGGSLNLTLNN